VQGKKEERDVGGGGGGKGGKERTRPFMKQCEITIALKGKRRSAAGHLCAKGGRGCAFNGNRVGGGGKKVGKIHLQVLIIEKGGRGS